MNRFLSRRIGISLMLFAVAVFALQFTTAAIAHAQGAAPPAQPEVSGVVSTLVLGSAASMPTGYLVGFFKHANPTASSKAIVIVAILAGFLSSLLMTMLAGGIQLTQLGIATVVIQGIGAAALAAGVNTTNASADAKRADAS
jgi:MFS family permease